MPRLPIADENVRADGSMWGYGELVSEMASRSKKRADGMWDFLKTAWPVRFCGSLGRNQLAHRGMMRGEVASLEGALSLRAACSSAGLTRKEESV